MQLQFHGKGVEVNDSVRSYAERKLARLERQLPDLRVELEIALEKNPSIAARNIASATVHSGGTIVRAHEAATGWEAAIDLTVDKLERQLVKAREKRRRRAPAPEPRVEL